MRRVFTLLLCAFLVFTLAAPIWAEGEEPAEETGEEEEAPANDPYYISADTSELPSVGGSTELSPVGGILTSIADFIGGLISGSIDISLLESVGGLVLDFIRNQAHFKKEDLRQLPEVAEPEPDTMKWVVRSIFGEYHPVTTTSVYVETVGNDTYEYLLDTVAPGIAGVDFEWVSGVVLFAISLYSLFRLIGVILS